MGVSINPYKVEERGEPNNMCDSCTKLAAWKITATPGEGYVARTMKLCSQHVRQLGDVVWHTFFDEGVMH